jgi:signal transduction histidine kinase
MFRFPSLILGRNKPVFIRQSSNSVFTALSGPASVVVPSRRGRRQTWGIEKTVKREGVSEERERIAREFRDTLEQELAAFTIQLGVVEAQFNGSPDRLRHHGPHPTRHRGRSQVNNTALE